VVVCPELTAVNEYGVGFVELAGLKWRVGIKETAEGIAQRYFNNFSRHLCMFQFFFMLIWGRRSLELDRYSAWYMHR
jgi:hypothetical protein